MKRLLALVLIAAALWSGYWAFGAWQIRKNVAAWRAQAEATGWTAEGALAVRGFPNRFDTTIEDLRLAPPRGDVEWQAPFVQLFQLSYRPHHLIAVWPDRQRLTLGRTDWQIASGDLRASLVLAPTSGAAERLRLSAEDLTARAEGGAAAGTEGQLESARLALTRRDGTVADYDLAAQADTLEVSLPQMTPFTVSKAEVEAVLRLTAAPGIALRGPATPPRLAEVEIARLEVSGAGITLKAEGRLMPDALGRATGEVMAEVSDWRAALALAREAGLPDETAQTLERGLSLLTGLSGSGAALKLPLRFEGGATFLGPLRLGPAPRLALN